VFDEHRPEVVFHAAALKHLPLLEMWPAEAYKTNVLGTLNVLEAGARHGVSTFVNISTDKAADPVSVLGYSKSLAERLTAGCAGSHDGTYLSVRFGNVLGSRGSVLTTFRAQRDAGGPITVTHPDATRYFMTVEEAVQLVIQAGAVGTDGEVMVLDMGDPVRIDDIAQRLARRSNPPTPVVYTGLRPGEKLHECPFGANERQERKVHPLISSVSVSPLPFSLPAKLSPQLSSSPNAFRTALSALCNPTVAKLHEPDPVLDLARSYGLSRVATE
jgi:FlaA1/EpsC-like NDP-sugar epimerase